MLVYRAMNTKEVSDMHLLTPLQKAQLVKLHEQLISLQQEAEQLAAETGNELIAEAAKNAKRSALKNGVARWGLLVEGEEFVGCGRHIEEIEMPY